MSPQDCWSYLRKYEVPYHPLHDVGFSSLGDVQSTKKVPLENWFTYGGERSGRFQVKASPASPGRKALPLILSTVVLNLPRRICKTRTVAQRRSAASTPSNRALPVWNCPVS
eukprot:scaffold47_cov258-Pinguiococcus_pyrenoidosus.AAC.86